MRTPGRPIEPRNLARSFRRICDDNKIRITVATEALSAILEIHVSGAPGGTRTPDRLLRSYPGLSARGDTRGQKPDQDQNKDLCGAQPVDADPPDRSS
jgi:hypothetical protein